MIAEVALNLPLAQTYHYLVPGALQASIERGMRVAVPFGPRERVAFVIGLGETSPIPVARLKAIRRVIDPRPVIDGDRWELAKWIEGYYACNPGEALALMVPSALRLKERPPTAPAAFDPGRMPGEAGLTLTKAQVEGLVALRAAIDARKGETVLVHGVTGSGKTELYLRAIAHALGQRRSAITLVPEIALTPQTINRFRERFGAEQVAVWHSRLSQSQRAAEWARLAAGERRIVIGARSAIFAPLSDLGVIVLDEEHEPTYKQEDAPHAHAREIAKARAKITGATVILGSATPSIESYYDATSGASRLISLPERVEGRPMPEVTIIDMRHEWGGRGRGGPFSESLQNALRQTVERGEQAMLFLNRRGFARVAQCQTCGVAARCERCSVPLIYHAGEQKLLCHYCGYQEAPPELCAHCKKGYVKLRGAGTERVESELHRLFPVASIARMDRDSTKARGAHEAIYEAVRRQDVGMLVGTQMIAKGLDFPQVTLVGVVSADTALNLPDFRAGERTFDLLTQVAGRAGRGDQPGRVLIQTYCPDHYAIVAAKDHDYARFYHEEIAMRERLQLPPFAKLIELMVSGSTRQKVYEAGTALGSTLQRASHGKGITLLGPAPHRIPRLRKQFRVCVLMKGASIERMTAIVRRVLAAGRRFQGLPVAVNVDP